MTPGDIFKQDCADEIEAQGSNPKLREITKQWFALANSLKYSYHFRSFGRPIIQYPQDIVAIQEIIWSVKPDLIIETGIAHGGSIIMSAAMLAMLDYVEASIKGEILDLKKSSRRVLGIDIDIREHNRNEIDAHPFRHKIDMLEGSSIDEKIIASVINYAEDFNNVMVILDSNHTQDHVLAELEAYAPLVALDSYCVVFDTVIDDLPKEAFLNRSWGPGDNPKTAMRVYLERLQSEGRKATDGAALHLEQDSSIDKKLLISVAPQGFLKRVT